MGFYFGDIKLTISAFGLLVKVFKCPMNFKPTEFKFVCEINNLSSDKNLSEIEFQANSRTKHHMPPFGECGIFFSSFIVVCDLMHTCVCACVLSTNVAIDFIFVTHTHTPPLPIIINFEIQRVFYSSIFLVQEHS